jgi:hypothetical protein
MVLPRPAERVRIIGRLEPQAGDLAAESFVAGRGSTGRGASLIRRHPYSLLVFLISADEEAFEERNCTASRTDRSRC